MGLFGTTKRTLVVDVAAVLKTKGVRGRAAPRQQLQLLRTFSRLVQRENINLTAVLVGKPLHKAPHNKRLDGVRTRYAKTEEKLNKELLRSCKQAGKLGVLVSENVLLENKMIRSGKETLRISTFRKLLDDGSELVKNRKGANRGNSRNRRDHGSRYDRKNDRVEKAPPKQNAPMHAKDEISQMIDLVE